MSLMIQVVDPVKDYVELMKTIVDFGQIKTFLAGSEISVWLIFITLENTLVPFFRDQLQTIDQLLAWGYWPLR